MRKSYALFAVAPLALGLSPLKSCVPDRPLPPPVTKPTPTNDNACGGGTNEVIVDWPNLDPGCDADDLYIRYPTNMPYDGVNAVNAAMNCMTSMAGPTGETDHWWGNHCKNRLHQND